MREGLLLGRGHEKLGAVAAISEGPAAISLSRGGALKTYSHLDPNEDAALFALGEGGMLAAVADGHTGSTASELAVETLRDNFAPEWTAASAAPATREEWCDAAFTAISRINQAILDQARETQLPAAHTTLSIALMRPGEDLALYASIGDSHIFEIRDDHIEEMSWSSADWEKPDPARTYFLGHALSKRLGLREMCAIHSRGLADIRAVLLATDGLSEQGIGVADPTRTALQAVKTGQEAGGELRPLEACKAVTEAALTAQRSNLAGDNVAAAVLWLEA